MDNLYIEISESSLIRNINNLRSLLSVKVKAFAVVKANAYGHGIDQIVTILERHGNLVDGYAVHSLTEALSLYNNGVSKPVLIMGYVPKSSLEEVIDKGFHFVLYNLDALKKVEDIVSKNRKKPFFHLKIETGTGRQGIDQQDIDRFIEIIKPNSSLQPTGIYTHFANIEDSTRHFYAKEQLEKFVRMCDRFESEGIKIPIRHTACSAAALLFPESHFDMVRLGISMYGYWPSRETLLSFSQRFNKIDVNGFLKPLLSWKCRVSQIKNIEKGEYIGYGLSYKTTYPSKIAILPVGYSDGYDRKLSNNSWVLIGGERAPIRARICMNITLLDVTHIPEISVEDEVTLIGKSGTEEVTADTLASLSDSINYEIVSRIAHHIPRYIVD